LLSVLFFSRRLKMESVATANTNFSLDLFKRLSADKRTGNVFFSPLSISSALAMVYLGARGNTATEMAQVSVELCSPHVTLLNLKLRFECGLPQQQPQDSCSDAVLWVLRFVKSEMTRADGHLHLQQQTQNVQVPKFLQTQKKVVHPSKMDVLWAPGLKAGDDLHVGFSKLISELNKAGAPYKLSMANRLYGEKSFHFLEQYIAETRKHYHAELEPVDFITGAEAARQNINAWVEKQTQVFCCQFISTLGQCSFFVFPKKIKNLLAKGTIDSMTRLVLVNAIYFKGNWEKKFNEAATREAPFQLNKRLNNKSEPVLQSFYILTGLNHAFDSGRCDFSGMSSGSELFLSKVVHKSFVEVNEEGTEAAAATAAVMMMRCARISTRFTADHPFLFFIRHNKSQNILFYGRFCSP
ncbi:SPB10 protein, partial [Atractosteus spatula]|nr:SPB10 protein [Atractosteus spatula]